MRRTRVIVAVVAVVGLLATFPSSSTAQSGGIQTWTGVVVSVSDGDTFDVRLSSGAIRTVRVAGINTNEVLKDPNCWAPEATDRLEQLIDGKTVKLRAVDPNSRAQGRLFRHVFVGSTNVAEKMLKEGYGIPFLKSPEFDYQDDYIAAFYEAFDAGRRIHDTDYCGAGPVANIEMRVNGDADGVDSENLNGEYVRIRNRGTSTLSLGGWLMHDSATDYYDFPSNASIPPGGVITVHNGSGVDTATHLYMGFSSAIYSSVDGAFLMDPDGDLRAFQAWPCDGLCGSSALPKLVIDEVQYNGPGNDSADPNVEWVAVRNADSVPVDLRDWSFVSKPYIVYSETSRVLNPGETLMLYIGEGGDSRLTMHWNRDNSILNNEGDSVALVSPDGDVATCRAWGSGSCANTRVRGHETAGSDFDGDGYDELVVGVPGEDFSTKKNAGSIVVIPGATNGVTRSDGRMWSQKGSVKGKPQRGDKFGSAVASADFNGDGYDDLAAGVPGEDVWGLNAAGAVNVVYGSRSGLRKANNVTFSQRYGVAGDLEAEDRFGAALAAGDFDGDGYDDLAIGVPGEDVGAAKNAGSVNVLFGSPSGLGTSRNVAFDQADAVGGPEAGDAFGSALAAGDFNGDLRDDLVVGAPGETVNGAGSAGQINVLYGSASGLSPATTALSQAGEVSGDPQSGDKFGASLAVGDFDGDNFFDVVVGVPGEAVDGRAGAGQANVVYGSQGGLAAERNAAFSQAGAVAGTPNAGDKFAQSVAVGDFDGDGFADVAAGAPGEDRSGKFNAGNIHMLYGSGGGIGTARNAVFDQSRTGESIERSDQFGASLRIVDFDGDGRDDLIVGSAREDVSGHKNAGAIGIIFGRAAGESPPRGGMTVSQDGAVPGRSERNDRFGEAL